MPTETIIDIEGLSFAYDENLALKYVSLSVYDWDFFGIIGPNGGGKTTLIKLILDLLPLKKGRIEIFNQSPKKVSPSRIGYVPQEKHYNKGFPIPVIDVVLMGRLSKKRIVSRYNKKDKEIACKSLHSVGIDHLYNKQMLHLSGGQKQRVAIARALASEPEILILDEPSTGIDPKSHDQLYELLEELNKTITIVMISHDLGCLIKRANGIAYVNKKVIVKRGDELSRKDIYDFYHTF